MALFLLFLFTALSGWAQQGGAVSGVVVSTWDGTPLSGVTVSVRGTTLAAQTDVNGRFQLDNVPPGDQTLRFSKSSFAGVSVANVRVLMGQTTTVNGNLRPEFYEMEEYEVTAEEFSEQTERIMVERQKSSTMIEAIGSEQFSRLGASDAAAALGKVTGASVADGKYAVIRGLADRYTSTTMNGNDLPSADPDRKAAQLDLFPAAFISKLDVKKMFTPDMPGGFAGGAIDIVTKGIPEQFLFNMSLGSSYNTESSLKKDFPLSDQGAMDWTAMDSGKRDLPGNSSNPRAYHSYQMGPVPGDSFVNSSMSMSVGDSFTVFGRRLGFLAGVNYKNDYKLYREFRKVRYIDPNLKSADKSGPRGVIEYNWGALGSIGFEPYEHQEIKFNYMYLQVAEDEAYALKGFEDNTTEGYTLYQDVLHWTERNLNLMQLAGKHEFPYFNNVRLDWAGSQSTTTQDEPDQRLLQYILNADTGKYELATASSPSKPARFWRELSEDNTSGRVDLTIPLPSYNSKDNLLKGGVAVSESQRDFEQSGVSINHNSTSSPFALTGDPQTLVDPANTNYFSYSTFPDSKTYKGVSYIKAGYLMADYSPLEWLRLVGGARVESTDIRIDTFNLLSGQPLTPGKIKQTDWLPSLGVTFYVRENILIRGVWSETVVRPTYREIAPIDFYDLLDARTVTGNPNLKMSSSRNYDLGIEWYPRPGELISVSVFVKEISRPIEQEAITVNGDTVTYNNSPNAKVRGIEGEIRENLGSLWHPLREFTLSANVAFIESEVPYTQTQYDSHRYSFFDYTTKHPLFEQPEYVINTDITWEHAGTGTALTVAGSVVGRRLKTVGLGTPDEYEEAAPVMDVFLSQKLGKHWKLKLSAKNILDPVYETTVTYPVHEYWPGKGGKPLVVKSYKKGITYGMSLGCEF